MNILVTGSAGFIGFHLINSLLAKGHSIVGIDNINDYYDIELKYNRLKYSGIDKSNINESSPVKSRINVNYIFHKIDLINKDAVDNLFNTYNFDQVIHLAAQAGVRHSIENPLLYINSNIIGFAHVLEACKTNNVRKILFASSSSVYGNRENVPFMETDVVDTPISMYAVTKKTNELMAYTYSHLYNINLIGMRFFTVYGPWGRPDMAPFIFTKNINEGIEIHLNNNGDMVRDFTYIDDIIDGIYKLSESKITPSKFEIYNIGCSEPVNLNSFVKLIEQNLNKPAKIIFAQIPKGDVIKTYSDISKIKTKFGYNPSIDINTGIKKFINWYKEYYKET